ncbi:hypothetical protein I6G65_16045 [Sphingomonas paucimobilis]|uniref:DNA, contig: SP630 n=1 Tax=Sphingomonas paucimobilis NBRC 13935 TaxID=1219050 RepID=A0A0C9NCV1_SPHPI|nr:hypothetical protein [Sphingomonas paucimobilis]QPS15801.1 hypothetical protein I6G65_16045 [Sphingomonas paucimobilis]GAN14127.1 hypothetical protein SP6_30_02680 [Sphingomonas paucimobilis NBRC 13935]
MADDLPRLADLPIPDTVQPGRGWSPFMLEMAAHIAPKHILTLVDRFGGQDIYVPIAVENSPFLDVLPADTVATISRVYGRERLKIPTAREALARARRAPVIAAVRAGRLTRNEAARMIGSSRRYVAYLANQTNEADDAPVFVPRRTVDSRQIEMFPEPPAPVHPD